MRWHILKLVWRWNLFSSHLLRNDFHAVYDTVAWKSLLQNKILLLILCDMNISLNIGQIIIFTKYSPFCTNLCVRFWKIIISQQSLIFSFPLPPFFPSSLPSFLLSFLHSFTPSSSCPLLSSPSSFLAPVTFCLLPQYCVVSKWQWLLSSSIMKT